MTGLPSRPRLPGVTKPPASLISLANAVRARDDFTPGRGLSLHEQTVSRLALYLGELLGLADDRVEVMSQAAAVHDIGKLAIPDSILLHPGKLGPAEWELLRAHTRIGSAILSGHDDPVMDMAAVISLGHHEAYDGTGYPYGLRGEQIPLEARIVTICDVYDALREERPYKAGRSHQDTMRLLATGDGRLDPTKFDPDVLRAFLSHNRHFERIWQEAKLASGNAPTPRVPHMATEFPAALAS